MVINQKTARNIFKTIGFTMADDWSIPRLQRKINNRDFVEIGATSNNGPVAALQRDILIALSRGELVSVE